MGGSVSSVTPAPPTAPAGAVGAAATTLPRRDVHPAATALLMILSDLLAITVAGVAVVLVRHRLGGQFTPALYWQFWPLMVVLIVSFAGAKLYRIPLSPAEEIRRVFMVATAVYLALGTVTFFLRGAEAYSRAIFGIAWIASIVLVLLGRVLLRVFLSRRRWWGCPVLIVGCGRPGRHIVRTLLKQPELGLKPVGILDDQPWRTGGFRGFRGVPMLGPTSRAVELARHWSSLRLLVVGAEMSGQRLNELLLHEQQHIRHLLIVPDMHGVTSIGVEAHDLSGYLGLYVRHRLLDPMQMAIKQAIDLLILVLIAPFVTVLALLLALAIRLDTPGPVFFAHERYGLGGRLFKVWKFRTMVRDADAVLARALADDPQFAREWKQTQKLRDDPRITRVGRFLRRTSLDELPQIWNVLVGQMSFVGPRPIIAQEVERYGSNYALYIHVRPGITGLWQVSGRNDLTYADRVRLDVHYVRNWSVWLDLFILSRTALVIALARGAY